MASTARAVLAFGFYFKKTIMQKITLLLLLLGASLLAISQETNTPSIVDGAYVSFKPEKSPNGPSTNKVIQLANHNGTTMLAIAACEKCFPAMYTYQADLSNQFGKTVFSNSFGIYVMQYNQNSLVIVAPSLKFDENFSFLNFYTTNKAELGKINKAKVEAFALPLLDIL